MADISVYPYKIEFDMKGNCLAFEEGHYRVITRDKPQRDFSFNSLGLKFKYDNILQSKYRETLIEDSNKLLSCDFSDYSLFCSLNKDCFGYKASFELTINDIDNINKFDFLYCTLYNTPELSINLQRNLIYKDMRDNNIALNKFNYKELLIAHF